MAKIPSIEELILAVYDCLDVDKLSSKQRKTWIQLRNPSEKYERNLDEFIDDFCRALSIDKDHYAMMSLPKNLHDFACFQIQLSRKVWTYDVDRKALLALLLVTNYIPGVAKIVGNWFATKPETNMPGGEIWYLPTPSKDGKNVDMPMKKVSNWLLDLMGVKLNQLGNQSQDLLNADKYIRNIYNWSNGKVPRVTKIREFITEISEQNFEGTIDLSNIKSIGEKLERVKVFLDDKGLDPTSLCKQIPMKQFAIESLINGESEEGSIEYFIQLVENRYNKPDAKLMLQRFLFARAVQVGYNKLCDHINPTVDRNMNTTANHV